MSLPKMTDISSAITNNEFLPWWEENKNNYKGILIDIDGTMMTKGTPLPGAGELHARLREQGYPFCFLTNDGDHSREEKSLSLKKAGLDIAPNEIVSCGQGLNLFVEEQQEHDELYFVMGLLGHPCYAENAGLKVTRDIAKLDKCKGVIVGEGDYDWLKVITAVINCFLKCPSTNFLVPNPDTYWPSSNSGIGVGAGGKARFICMVLAEAGVNLKPTYLGKPHSKIYDFALQHIGNEYFSGNRPAPETILTIGDSLNSDVLGGNLYGAKSALLLTGITTPELLKQEGIKQKRPQYVFNTL